jgi:hypothetical protein
MAGRRRGPGQLDAAQLGPSLYQCLRRGVPDDLYRSASAVELIEARPVGTTLHLRPGGSVDFDLVVCADGYRSMGRRLIDAGATPCYRGMVSRRGPHRSLGCARTASPTSALPPRCPARAGKMSGTRSSMPRSPGPMTIATTGSRSISTPPTRCPGRSGCTPASARPDTAYSASSTASRQASLDPPAATEHRSSRPPRLPCTRHPRRPAVTGPRPLAAAAYRKAAESRHTELADLWSIACLKAPASPMALSWSPRRVRRQGATPGARPARWLRPCRPEGAGSSWWPGPCSSCAGRR